ncbi:MAG: class I SAM-dependent methyltransferase [Bacillota bacterium]|jgi:S-adenosylmethionine-dependent methyltransferase
MSRRVETYYDSHAESEWDRLDLHRMEFLTTLRAMNEFIPPRSTNLDVGAGPGRYSIELAKAGHIVTLLDLSPRNVELARQKASNQGAAIAEFVCGKALDLSRFVDSSFEVVLLVGPLYHLVEPSDRDLAINEALRVLKPNGLLFASFISRYAVYVDLLKSDPGLITRYATTYGQLMATAVHIPNEQNPGFTDAHFMHPKDIEPLMSRHGLITLRLAVSEGLIAPVEPSVNALPKEAFDQWVEVCYRLGTDPITWGAGEHMLYVGRKEPR